jgi:hypothetical protein
VLLPDGGFEGGVGRGPGGADDGRVVMLSAGSGFPFTWGITSSRLMGIPREIRCCRRMRDRVQFTGRDTVDGDALNRVWYNVRLIQRFEWHMCDLYGQPTFQG